MKTWNKHIAQIFLVILTAPGFLLAHEGHDHDAPSGLQPKRGGIIKALDDNSVEVVSQGQDLEIFLFDKDENPAEVSKYAVTASAQMPRTKTKLPVALTAEQNSFKATFDGKGTHRYTLILEIKAPGQDFTNKVNFTIEPKKKAKANAK